MFLKFSFFSPCNLLSFLIASLTVSTLDWESEIAAPQFVQQNFSPEIKRLTSNMIGVRQTGQGMLCCDIVLLVFICYRYCHYCHWAE